MTKFDPARGLILTQNKTIHGFRPHIGSKLVIVDEPSVSGEVTAVMAERLHGSGLAVYEDDYRPTPVETDADARTRASVDALVAAEPVVTDGGKVLVEAGSVSTPADLEIWQADDEEAGKKAGDRVTRADLIVIAGRENVAIETDDNKPAIIQKIVVARAVKLLL